MRKWNLTRRDILWVTAICLLMMGIFLILSSRVNGPGFPLDDAWIHQTYARNLVEFGQWAFIPGKLSAGSTAPVRA